jgi:hypothetical protein
LTAIYDPTEQGGLAKLRAPDAALAFVPYPFFFEHGAELKLSAIAQADLTGTGTQERWTLVAKAGNANSAASLSGYTLLSDAGYAPQFVRHAALEAWPIPADVKIVASGQILSALRRIAGGEPVVALLDQTEAAALPTLPFAAQLKAVTQSAPLPVALVAVVDTRVPAARAHALQAALLRMGHGGNGTDSLGSLRLQGFVLPRLPGSPPPP